MGLGGYPSLGAAGELVLVFTVCMGVTLPRTEVTQNYPLFLFAGQLPWLLFSDTVPRSASSVLEQGSLITKTVFPAEIIPNSVFLSTLVGHLFGLALMVGAVALILNQISIFLVLLPLLYAGARPALRRTSVGSWLACTFSCGIWPRSSASFYRSGSGSAILISEQLPLEPVLCCSPIRSSTSYAPTVNFC